MQTPDQGMHLLPGMRPRVPPGRGGIILSHLFSGTGGRRLSQVYIVSLVTLIAYNG